MNAHSARSSLSSSLCHGDGYLSMRGERKRKGRALIVGGLAIGWAVATFLLTLKASAWAFALMAAAILLGSIAKTISVYRSL